MGVERLSQKPMVVHFEYFYQQILIHQIHGDLQLFMRWWQFPGTNQSSVKKNLGGILRMLRPLPFVSRLVSYSLANSQEMTSRNPFDIPLFMCILCDSSGKQGVSQSVCEGSVTTDQIFLMPGLKSNQLDQNV